MYTNDISKGDVQAGIHGWIVKKINRANCYCINYHTESILQIFLLCLPCWCFSQKTRHVAAEIKNNFIIRIAKQLYIPQRILLHDLSATRGHRFSFISNGNLHEHEQEEEQEHKGKLIGCVKSFSFSNCHFIRQLSTFIIVTA